MGGKEFDSLVAKIFGVDVSDVPVNDEDREEPSPEPSPIREQGDFSDLSEPLEIMFPDPIEDAKQSLGELTDECSACADYWDMMDIDPVRLLDTLIEYAEAV